MAAPIQRFGEKIIPTIWQERIIKRDFDIVLGKMLQSEQQNNDETEEPYLRTANVQWDGIDISDVNTMWFSTVEKDKLLLRQGDLVVNEGGDVGRCAIWNNELPVCYFQNAVNRVRQIQKSNTAFLYYWLHNMKHAGFIDSLVGKTTIAHLTAEKLEALPFPATPWKEQEHIVRYLDASCAAIDVAVKAKRSQIEILDELRRTTIQQAVTKGIKKSQQLVETGSQIITQIPQGWKLIRLKSISEIRYGLGQPPAEKEGGVPMIRATNVDSGKITERNLLCVDPDELPLDREPYLKAGEIIVVRSGAYTGDSSIIPQEYEGAVAGYDMVVHVTHADPKFIAYSLLSPHILHGQIKLLTLRAAQPHLNAQELGSIIFAIPLSREEQVSIVRFLDDRLAEISEVESIITKQINTLLEYRKSLIHECVTGQRRVTEADLKQV